MTVPPPPPPPPPEPSPPESSNNDPSPSSEIKASSSSSFAHKVIVDESVLSKVSKAASLLETNRCLESEHEAALHFASTLLSHPNGLPHDGTGSGSGGTKGISSNTVSKIMGSVPPGVKDAWLALVQNSNTNDDDLVENSTAVIGAGGGNMGATVAMPKEGSSTAAHEDEYEYPLPRGQLAKATKITALSASLQRTATIAQQLQQNQKTDADCLMEALKTISEHAENSSGEGIGMGVQATTPAWFMNLFDDKVREIREYHAKHPNHTNLIHNGGDASDYSIYQMTMGGKVLSTGVDETTSTISQITLNQGKKRKMGNPLADGYDLHSIIHQPLQKIKTGQTFSIEEVMGKYLDLQSLHQSMLLSPQLNSMFGSANTNSGIGDGSSNGATKNPASYNRISYPDFVTMIADGMFGKIPEEQKLKQRKKYLRFLGQLEEYLVSFLHRVSPLLDVETVVIKPANQEFNQTWCQHGGIPGSWELKPIEKKWVITTSDKNSKSASDGEMKEEGINLKVYATVQDLMDKVTADALKVELARLGMKCGGMPSDRAKRLWHTRDTPLDQLPAKLFTKKKGKTNKKSQSDKGIAADLATIATNTNTNVSDNKFREGTSTYVGSNQRRVDIARLEATVSALLNQVRPTLDATARRAERRLTQTSNEKEREMEEELTGAYEDKGDLVDGGNEKDDDGDSDSDDDDDAPIYNPKGVPLGWDGKPIPYWLFKLHGLNHFYPCEICGNESYRGRHNFEKHFAEVKHSYGMKCLGIPNTKHFHGVTKIEDAQNLWQKLQQNVNKDIFDASKEEEYEDSHGNVLSRATYEDLARQGLL